MSKVKAASTEVAVEKHKQVVFDSGRSKHSLRGAGDVREVLLIGLASYGEVERLASVQSNYASELYVTDEDDCRRAVNPDLMVQYEDSDLKTVTNSRALKYLDILKRKMLQAGEPPDPPGTI